MASRKTRTSASTSPKVSTSTLAHPDVAEPIAPAIERVDESILTLPEPTAETIEQTPSEAFTTDEPGPSSTFIPRQPSPPLPDLRTRRFPPEYSDPEDDDDSDDEIVATLPIYISPVLHPHLHLFQYPLHTRSLAAPTWAVQRGQGITTRVKEKASRIEVEIPVDAGPTVWRDSRASDLGMTRDDINGDDIEGGYGFGGRGDEAYEPKKGKGKGGAKGKEREKKWGERVRLRSEEVPSATGYYAGLIHDGALHLHPLSRILQMRTSLQYLDDFEQKEKYGRRRGVNGEEDGPEPPEARRPMQAPTLIRPSRKGDEEEGDGSGSIKDFRNKMWRLAAEEADDTWVPYEWRTGDDDRVLAALQKMVVPVEKRERLTCLTRGLDYLDKAQ